MSFFFICKSIADLCTVVDRFGPAVPEVRTRRRSWSWTNVRYGSHGIHNSCVFIQRRVIMARRPVVMTVPRAANTCHSTRTCSRATRYRLTGTPVLRRRHKSRYTYNIVYYTVLPTRHATEKNECLGRAFKSRYYSVFGRVLFSVTLYPVEILQHRTTPTLVMFTCDMRAEKNCERY